MDPLLLGETLSASASGEKFYGFWMPARGNDGVGGVDVFNVSGTSAFKVVMETKSSDVSDASAGITDIGTVTVTSSTPQLFKLDVSDAEDLVRYRLESLSSGSIHFQFTQPLWAPN